MIDAESVSGVIRSATWWMRRRPVGATALLLLTLAGALVAGSWALAAARWAAFAVQASVLTFESAAEAEAVTSTLHFRYKGCTRFITVPVGQHELAAARALDTGAVFRSPQPLRAAYFRSLVAGQSRAASVRSVVSQLRQLRSGLGLDSDQYAELIVRFVQAVPYGGVDGRVRLPAEVFADGIAACDDRSLLLAALLLHEDYDVAMFAFDYQSHAAVGLRSTEPGFQGTGYAFIETNRPAFIGEAGGSYAAWAAWRRKPQVVRLGGSRVYSAEEEASFVAEMLERSHAVARQLDDYVGFARSGPDKWRPTYVEQARRKFEADRTVALIKAHDFDRASLFEALVARAPSPQ